MHYVRYESVSELTFCLDDTPYTAPASVIFTARQEQKVESPSERPMPVRGAPEDPNGLLRLNVREHRDLMRAIDKYIHADMAFRIKANFKNSRTGEVTLWSINVNVKPTERTPARDTQEFTFYSGDSSEYPVGSFDLTKC